MIKQKKAVAETLTVQKAALLKAVKNTYDDSKFFVGRGVLDDCDFTQGLNRNRSEFISKYALLEEIKVSKYDRIGSMPGFPDNLVLDPKTYVYCDSISDNQIYNTDAPDGYYHSASKHNPHLEVFIKIDRENMTISFLLGEHQKTLLLKPRTKYTYKLLKTMMYCVSADDLERFMKDEFWNPMFINIGRKALGLDGCQFLMTQ